MEQRKPTLLEEIQSVYLEGETAMVAWIVAKIEGLERHIQRLEEQMGVICITPQNFGF